MLFGQPILAIDNFREMLPRQESIVVSHRSSTEQDAHCTLGSEVASREMLVVAIRTRRSFLITRLGPITPSRLGDRVPTRDGWYSKVPRRCPASIIFSLTTFRYQYLVPLQSPPHSTVSTLSVLLCTSCIRAFFVHSLGTNPYLLIR